MEIFISWSGDRSKKAAEALGQWIKCVIQSVDPWISTGIEKGKRWSPEISSKLEQSKIGIICLTSENLEEPWILFEAGALAKTSQAKVCTFLLDIQPTDVKEPLSQFQHTLSTKEDISRLVSDINKTIHDNGSHALDDVTLGKTFDKFWPELEQQFKEIISSKKASRKGKRSDREILEEILEVTRRIEKNPLDVYKTSFALDTKDTIYNIPFRKTVSLKPSTFNVYDRNEAINVNAAQGVDLNLFKICSSCGIMYSPRAIGENGKCPSCNVIIPPEKFG